MIATIGCALFLVGCGSLVTFGRCDELDTIERTFLRFAAGTAVGPMVVVVLYELLEVPFHAMTIVVVGAAGLVLLYVDERRFTDPRRVRLTTSWTVWLLAAGTFGAMLAGALRFPGFGGRDSWHHALGTAWLLESGRLRQPFADWPLIHYVDGYPPAFEIVLAFFATPFSHGVSFPLKSVAALVGAASILAVYFLGRRVIGSETGGVIAAIFYAVAPGALSRQIWGHSQAVVLILAGLACAVTLKDSARLLPSAAVCFGGALLAAPSQGAKGLALAALTWAVARATARATARAWYRRLGVAMVGAVILASAWFVPLLARTGVEPTAVFSAMDNPELRRSGARWQAEDGVGGSLEAAVRGSEHRRYGLDDILFFRPHVWIQPVFGPKRINFIVPEGLGAPVLVLALVGLFVAPTVAKRGSGLPVRLLIGSWLLFTAVGIAGASIGVSFYTWRFWLLLVPIASVAASVGAIGLIGSHASRGARWAVGAASVLGGAQLVLAVVTDTAAGIWRFWFLNPLFIVVAATAAAWAGRWLIRTRRPMERLTAAVVLMHVLIASPARLRALTVQVESRVFSGPEETLGYLKIPEVTPRDALIFPLSGGDRNAALVGLDRVCRPWDRRWLEIEQQLEANPCSISPGDLVRRLHALDVDYVVVDPSFRRSQFLHCEDPKQFRATVVGLLQVPGTSLALSVPPPGEPSDSRVIIVEISAPDAPRE